MATFTVGGKFNAHTSLRDVAASLLSPADRGNAAAVEAMLRKLVGANSQLKNQTSYLGGHLLNLPAGVTPLNQTQQSAYDLMSNTLKSWGLATLVPDLKKFIIQGDTNADTLALALSQTDAYKKRFAGNADRIKNGLAELAPAQYIATEEQYRNVLRSYGLPQGFYDSPADLDKFIAQDVSPTELESRVKVATDQYMNADSTQRDIWQQYFGLSQGDAVAHMIDPNKYSLTDLQNKATQVGIGTAAAEQGLGVSADRAQYLQQRGVTLQGAQQAYAAIGSAFGTDQSIANRFGSSMDQNTEENARLLNQGEDVNKLSALYSNEQALFKDRPGANANSLAPNLSSNL